MYRFNRCSLLLLIVYLTSAGTMEYYSHAVSMEGIYLTFPLIVVFIIWSERTTLILQKVDSCITKTESFYQDLFLISLSFLLGHFLALLFQYNNSDALGWWPIATYFVAALGILFALVFSKIAMMRDAHRKYTLIYSMIILLFFMFTGLMMHLNPLSLFSGDTLFYIILLLLIGMHLLLCIRNKRTDHKKD